MPIRIGHFLANLRVHGPVLVLIAIALGTSVILVPGPREKAYQELNAGHVTNAIARLEKLVTEGDHSVWTLTTLARAHELNGDEKKAIAVLEFLISRRPNHMQVLGMLEALYDGAGEKRKLIEVLDKKQALAPTAERQRLIARLWSELDEREKQRQALRKLVDSFGGNRDDYLQLARLEASEGRPGAAANVLQALSSREPVNAQIISWEMTLWRAVGQVDHAVARGRDWLRQTGRLDEAGKLTPVFTSRSLHESAAEMLRPFASKTAPPELIALLAEAEYNSGNIAAGIRLLDEFETRYGRATRRTLKLMYLRLAIRLNQLHRALPVADALGIETLSASFVSDLAAAALRSNRIDVLQRIRRVAPSRFAMLDPLLRAQVHLALGESNTARQLIELVAEESAADPVRMITVAGLQLRMGNRAVALAILRSITGSSAEGHSVPDHTAAPLAPVPSYLLKEIAWLYVRAGATHEGRMAMERFRREQPSVEADYAWAIAAVMSSREHEVLPWFREVGRQLPAETLKELATISIGAKAHMLAADAARALVQRRGNDADKLLLAETRIAAGRPWVPVR